MSKFLLYPCALAALSALPLAADEKAPAIPEKASAEAGTPATFSWVDLEGDGRLELAAVSADGVFQLLAAAGENRFEDVSARVGLAGITHAALALWMDYDADGRLDLFVGARAGASRLFRNEGGTFVDMTSGAGLTTEGAVRSADWLDHDGDGRADLHVVTAERHELYRGLGGGFFERTELPLLGAGGVVGPSGVVVTTSATGSNSGELGSSAGQSTPRVLDGVGSSGSRAPLGPPPSVGGATPISVFPSGCASSIKDQTNPGTCLQASTTPTLGKLYPISTSLFVALSGDVGIGTTSPATKLHVAGTARITDTLTLAPSGDMALDVSTGSIYKGGALFIHTKGNVTTTAIGRSALSNVTTGLYNTATGAYALFANTTGVGNTANGYEALFVNTTGSGNTANGYVALSRNTIGHSNTANGSGALSSNTTGSDNTANGAYSLSANTTGTGNMASGFKALQFNTTGGANTASGTEALRNNTIGTVNTASGYRALQSNTTGASNTASGYRALAANTTGSRNIAVGKDAGMNLTTGDDNIDIGNPGAAAESATIRIGSAQTRAFIAGIRGVCTGVANGVPVLVDSAGQLGTCNSSRRFKKDIADMGDRTERLLELRPVVFHYKQEQVLPDASEVPLEYGLIAEEVAEIFPELVVFDEEGQPFTVKYHLLSAMLLNELQKLHEQGAEQAGEFKELHEQDAQRASELKELRTRLARVEGRVAPAAPPAATR